MPLAPSRVNTGYFNPTPTITTPTTSPTSPLQPGSTNTGSLVPILGGRTGTTTASPPPTQPTPTPTPTGGGNYNPNGGGTTGTVGGSVGGSTGTTTGATDPWSLYWSMGGPYNPNNPYPAPAGGGGTSIQNPPPGVAGGGTTPPPTIMPPPSTTLTPTVSGPTGTVGGSVSGLTEPSFSISMPSSDQNTTQPVDYARLFNPTMGSSYDGTVLGDPGPSISLGDGAQSQTTPGQVDYKSLFNPSMGGGYDGTTVGYDATQPSTVFPLNPSALGTTTGSTGSTSDPSTMFPTGAQTLNQPMYPWLSPYQGNFAAPMTPYENQGLNAMSSFVGSGENLGGAQSYLGNVLSGQYLDPSTNPNLQKYVDSLSGIHDYQDNLERQRIGSSMAAGGNALSGARAMAESEYQNQSNNQYQNMIASMLNQNYQNERGLQNSAVPLEMGMSNELMGGYGSLINAGGLPRSIQQTQNNAEYADFLRQITGMQQAYNQPTQEMQALLHSGYPGSYQQQYGPSSASTWASLLAALLGGGGSGGSGGSGTGSLLGGLGSALSSLFGGGNGSGTPSGPSADQQNPYNTDYGSSSYGYGSPTGTDYGPFVDPSLYGGDYSGGDYSGGASSGDYYGPTYDPYYGPGQGGG